MCQLKSNQMLHSCTKKNHMWKGNEEYGVVWGS